MAFSQTFFLLNQECYLIEGTLAAGLNSLMNAGVANRGECYAAFFNLATALERLMKLAVLLDHMARNNFNALCKNDMKKYGHDLMSLYERIAQLARENSTAAFLRLEQDSTGLQILQFLSEFARVTRYANFDQLAGKSQVIDPLEKWNEILGIVIQNEVSRRQKSKAQIVATNIAKEIANSALIRLHDLAKHPMSLEDCFRDPKVQALAASRIAWHLIQLIASIKQVVADCASNATVTGHDSDPSNMHIPDMTEFITFALPKKQWVMKKKRWP